LVETLLFHARMLLNPRYRAVGLVALPVLYGLILTLGAAVLEDATTNRHPSWADLRRILRYAAGENFGYRQLGHVWRVEGLWQLAGPQGRVGAMERQGLSRPGDAASDGTGPAGTQSPRGWAANPGRASPRWARPA
jgi:hypothetical protein